MINECTITKRQTETIHIVFHNETQSTKTINRLYIDLNNKMVTNTANRASHERVINQIHHYKQKPNHEYSLVKLELLPSGTVAQRLGFQDIWMNIWMTLWHTGTLLAHLACW